jgi:hypothetical protein
MKKISFLRLRLEIRRLVKNRTFGKLGADVVAEEWLVEELLVVDLRTISKKKKNSTEYFIWYSSYSRFLLFSDELVCFYSLFNDCFN